MPRAIPEIARSESRAATASQRDGQLRGNARPALRPGRRGPVFPIKGTRLTPSRDAPASAPHLVTRRDKPQRVAHHRRRVVPMRQGSAGAGTGGGKSAAMAGIT